MGFRFAPGCCCNKKPCPLTVSVADCLPVAVGHTVQQVTLTGSPTNGTFTFALGAYTTAPIAYNADTVAIQSALEALPIVGEGNVTVTGGPFPKSPITVTFTNAVYLQFAPNNIPTLSATLTGLTGAQGATFALDVLILPGNVPDGATYTLTSNATQLLKVSGATGGTLPLVFGGQTTGELAYNASASVVEAALAALPSIGAGNATVNGLTLTTGLTVALVGSLAGQSQPLITSDPSKLTPASSASVTITSILTGGTTIGPTPFPPNGEAGLELACGSWTVTAKAPLFITQSEAVLLPESQLAPAFQLAPQDGYTLIPPSNTPVVAPANVTLTGDPLGAGALQLISCTNGDCTYEVAVAPQTLAWGIAPENCGGTGNPYTLTASRYVWYKAFYPCGSTDGTLEVLWAIIGNPPPPGYPTLYLPPDDSRNVFQCFTSNGTPYPCGICTAGIVNLTYGDNSTSHPCGQPAIAYATAYVILNTVDNPPDFTTEYILSAAGCMSGGSPEWVGAGTAAQWIAILGVVPANPCAVAIDGSNVTIPCITVSR